MATINPGGKRHVCYYYDGESVARSGRVCAREGGMWAELGEFEVRVNAKSVFVSSSAFAHSYCRLSRVFLEGGIALNSILL